MQLLQSTIPPAMLTATFTNTERHGGLFLQAEATNPNTFCNPIISISTKASTCQVSFSSVNYGVIYIY
jgi:hypothetical protein